MDSLEGGLRRVLGHDRWSLQPRNDAFEVVTTGVVRRRRNRTVLAITMAVVAVALGASAAVAAINDQGHRGSTPTGPTPTRDHDVVPWLDHPAGRPPDPPHIPVPPVSYEACTASQLSATKGRGGAAAGSWSSAINITNVSTRPCWLIGYPTALIGHRASGADVVLHPARDTMFDDQTAWTANLRPGERAKLIIAAAGNCEAMDKGHSDPFSGVTFGIPGGGSLHVDVPFDAVCFLGVTRFGQSPPASYYREPDPLYPGLFAISNVPRSVLGGSTISFTVSLTNDAKGPVALDPCPVYLVAVIGSSRSLQGGYYELNCQTVSSVPAGATVTYDMRLKIPAVSDRITVKVTWAIPSSNARDTKIVTIEPGSDGPGNRTGARKSG